MLLGNGRALRNSSERSFLTFIHNYYTPHFCRSATSLRRGTGRRVQWASPTPRCEKCGYVVTKSCLCGAPLTSRADVVISLLPPPSQTVPILLSSSFSHSSLFPTLPHLSQEDKPFTAILVFFFSLFLTLPHSFLFHRRTCHSPPTASSRTSS